ncbi:MULTISPECIES: thioesterase family protein [Chromohalobacter]|uniref:thioesterase family protein n=1 Tax=Chromohalobacter TaxID=42054 RepID=UPI001FFD8CA6|nr:MULTISPECIES: thioesterase family protein [Chromohalobacter]MCK2045860.1 thioesterase family protein [Chromohalobacter moromii]MCT8469181.1 thioesterase family protein [Chromohalobacter canadensis]MCT8472629.1 thioesterase family protein [Chromohalobacter canadensis]MCT8500082.1 thioesterase family protein [Chromohalobacter canadensis]
MSRTTDSSTFDPLLETRVADAWVDYNGHMNDAEYARVFSLAVEALMERIGLDVAGRAEHGYTLYTLETHLCYRQQAHRSEALVVDLTLLDHDAKRLHVFFTLRNVDGDPLATSEQMLMGIDVASGRPGPFPEPVAAVIETLPSAGDEWPSAAGRRIGIVRR